MITTILIAIAALALGHHLGRRSTGRRHREDLARQATRLQRVIDFADDYIERTAPQRALIVLRNGDGHIVELAMRCSTGAFALRELLEGRQRRKALH